MDNLKFPANPLIDQVYSLNGKAWLWNGKRWTPIYKRTITDIVPGKQSSTNNQSKS